MRDGLETLFPRLWRMCLAVTGQRDWADDLAQMTCARALEKAHLYDPDGAPLDRWLFTMARRLWLNELRARKVRDGAGHEDSDTLVATDPPPETNIFAHQVLDRVMALSDGQRLAVLLVYVEGYSYKEASEALDVPIGTIMSRLAAARRKLAGLQTPETGET